MPEISHVEKEIIELTAGGFTMGEIATRLKHTEKTIESYRSRLLKKLGVQNAPHMVSFAYQNGILTRTSL